MNPIEKLESVLCDPEGKCCIRGSEADRTIVDEALAALRKALAQPVPPAAPQAVPLTQDQAMVAVKPTWNRGSMMDVVRSIEAAHGIGAQK